MTILTMLCVKCDALPHHLLRGALRCYLQGMDSRMKTLQEKLGNIQGVLSRK